MSKFLVLFILVLPVQVLLADDPKLGPSLERESQQVEKAIETEIIQNRASLEDFAVGYGVVVGDYTFPMRMNRYTPGEYYLEQTALNLSYGDKIYVGKFSANSQGVFFASEDGLKVQLGSYQGPNLKAFASGWDIKSVAYIPEVIEAVTKITPTGSALDPELVLSLPLEDLVKKQSDEKIPMTAQAEKKKLSRAQILTAILNKPLSVDGLNADTRKTGDLRKYFEKLHLISTYDDRTKITQYFVVLKGGKAGDLDMKEAELMHIAEDKVMFGWINKEGLLRRPVQYYLSVNPETLVAIVIRDGTKQLLRNLQSAPLSCAQAL